MGAHGRAMTRMPAACVRVAHGPPASCAGLKSAASGRRFLQIVTFERRQPVASESGLQPAQPGSMGSAALGMESLEPAWPGARRLGAVLPPGPQAGDIVDLNRALAIKLAFDDAGAPEAEADSLLPPTALGFLARFDRALEAAHTALAWVLDALGRYDGPDLMRAGVVEPRRRIRLCAPVPRPGKILAVAHNYPAHASESGSTPSREPVLFLKAPSAVIGPDDEITIPGPVKQADYEGELAVVIGRRARGVAAPEALEYVAGYTVANDVSARDFQNVHGQHFAGKSCDTFAPLGPALVTADEIPDPQDLGLRTTLSGEVVQSARTKEMTFSVAQIIAFASSLMTLEPGDVLLTGTPAGVGATREPQRFLREGDVVDVEIERIGRLRNYVRARPEDA